MAEKPQAAKITEVENGYVLKLSGNDKDRFYTPHQLRDALDKVFEHMTGVSPSQMEFPGEVAK